MLEDFKKFAVKGNVMDLAVGVIIGGAFGKIVTSLVNDIIMPLLGILLGGVSFTKLKLQVGGAVIQYGSFIQSIVDFLIVSFSIFIFIRAIAKFAKKPEEKAKEEAAEKKEVLLLTEIRDLLKEQR